MTLKRPGALGLLSIEETEAWATYLEACQAATEFNYDEVEPWAWSRLAQRLSTIAAQRARLEDDGA